MKKFQIITLLLVSLLAFNASNAQDPAFSQFFSSPLNINPALTANINSDWRMISNLRSQWLGPAAPYTTGTISYDTKLSRNYENVPQSNYVGIGGMMMYDKAMGGVQKSTYASVNLSYNVKLAEDDYGNTKKLSIGLVASTAAKTSTSQNLISLPSSPVLVLTTRCQAEKQR